MPAPTSTASVSFSTSCSPGTVRLKASFPRCSISSALRNRTLPRQRDDTIPKELDRVCLKALSKRVTDRYSTAQDMADDLRAWQSSAAGHRQSSAAGHRLPAIGPSPAPAPVLESSVESRQPIAESRQPSADSSSHLVKVVSRGLRSFGVEDADFFLELLPGPRGRDGLPDSLRFWKRRIEETDPDETFSVGMLYGPSGCGKTCCACNWSAATRQPRPSGRILRPLAAGVATLNVAALAAGAPHDHGDLQRGQ